MSSTYIPFRLPYEFKTYELDSRKRLPPWVLYRLLQEAAERHAVHLGFDSESLLQRNLSWVLYRFHLEVRAYPEGRGIIEIETWPSKVESRWAHREFLVYRGPGSEPIARASSVWLLLDVVKLRPVLLSGVLGTAHSQRPEHAIGGGFPTWNHTGTGVSRKLFPVRLADVDINGHVNNLHYLEWIAESVPEEIWRTSIMTELAIEYRRQVRYGETVTVETSTDGRGAYTHVLLGNGTTGELVLARTCWKSATG